MCDTPEVTTISTVPTGTASSFDCVLGGNATAERFYLSFCGEGTGAYRFRFDKSDADMFKGYFLKIKNTNKVVWRIEAKWDPTTHEPVPKNNGSLDATKPACLVLTCDSDRLGDMAQTVTFEKGTVVKFEFGAWDLDVEYYGE